MSLLYITWKNCLLWWLLIVYLIIYWNSVSIRGVCFHLILKQSHPMQCIMWKMTSMYLWICPLQVNITVLDINDNAPMWRDEPYQANVVEMSPIDTDVITVSALIWPLTSELTFWSQTWPLTCTWMLLMLRSFSSSSQPSTLSNKYINNFFYVINNDKFPFFWCSFQISFSIQCLGEDIINES